MQTALLLSNKGKPECGFAVSAADILLTAGMQFSASRCTAVPPGNVFDLIQLFPLSDGGPYPITLNTPVQSLTYGLCRQVLTLI